MKSKAYNLFIFFIAFPCIDIFGLSITLFLFFSHLIFTKYKFSNPFSSLIYSGIFISALISLFSSYFISEVDNPSITNTLLLFARLFYWLSVGLYFEKNFKVEYIYNTSKYFFYGLLFSICTYYFFQFQFELGPIKYSYIFRRNEFVFNFLCSFPFAYHFVTNQKTLRYFKFLFIILCFLAMSFTDGRSGFILFIFQILVIYLITNNQKKNIFKYFSFAVFLFLIITSFNIKIADLIRPVSERTANLILSEGDGDINYDKSLMVRSLMIDKSVSIIKEYPVAGIGFGNFINYDYDLIELRKYDRLLKAGFRDKYFNTRSTHNTYLEILTEFGIIGGIIFALLFYKGLTIFLNNIFKQKIIYLSLPFITILIYFGFISALTGTITWVLIGISRSKIFISDDKFYNKN